MNIILEGKLLTLTYLYILLEKPPYIAKEMAASIAVIEGENIILHCETSTPDCTVKWFKNEKLLKNTSKHKISRSGTEARLIVYKSVEEDAATYECHTVAMCTKTVVKVNGKEIVLLVSSIYFIVLLQFG